ncbi:26S proteasome non-ATPase regulatory subunit 10-like protein [Trifolium pratense]|uniref:26S proteasome non-ATPase regulatory subunit 10-like protein n=1 Tax=Trifolium pratense TaxID=57577 RepID=A0A2K3M2N5_TRIPR|nr:26S proteasome non-ATPase regulatory subunit 10-like protein [Trifolium pratense]
MSMMSSLVLELVFEYPSSIPNYRLVLKYFVALLLIRHGADVDVEDKEGYTVLGRVTDDGFRTILIDAAKTMLE